MKDSNIIIFFMLPLLCIFCSGMAGAEPSIVSGGSLQDMYIEGTYYGRQNITFSLSAAKDNFVKTYSNGVVIIGEKEKGDVIYHFIDTNKRLITKISQGNLYRMGEFANWDNMVGLISLTPGAKPAQGESFDEQNECTFYNAGHEGKVRVCMNDLLHVPVYIEQNGVVVERTTRMEAHKSCPAAADLLRRYLEEKYRYVDADDDISTDAD